MTGTDADRVVTLMLVRHGETARNVAGRFQSEFDEPLNDRGRRQAAALGARLAAAGARSPTGHTLGVVHSSTALRARQTADLIAAALELPRENLHELTERRLGALDGLEREKWQREHPYLMGRLSDDDEYAPPDGESMTDARMRFVVGLRRSIRRTPAEVQGIVVVAHGAVIAGLLRTVDPTGARSKLPGHCTPLTLIARSGPGYLHLSRPDDIALAV